MGNGYVIPASDPIDQLMLRLRDIERRVSESESFTGAEIADALQTLTDLVTGLLTQVNGVFSGYLSVTGNSTLTGGITSTGVAGFNVTTLPGGRSAVWIHDASGVMGQTTSSIVYKMDLGELPFTATDFIATSPYVYHYRAQVDIRDNPENPFYDPDYEVPWEVGYMAEHLVENNLGLFVLYDSEGVPKNIMYDLFGAVAAVVIGREHDRAIGELRAEVAELRSLVKGYGSKA